MPKYQEQLNDIFTALSDPTRRGVITHLCQGPKTVSELAQPYSMSLPSFTQHLKVLEKSGLVSSKKEGRSRIYTIAPKHFDLADNWLEEQRLGWEQRLDRLDEYLLNLKDNMQ